MDSWLLQLFSLFVLFALALVAFFYVFQRPSVGSNRSQLVDQARAMIGRQLQLDSDLRAGQGEAWVAGAMWSLRAEQQLAGGVQVEVIDTDGLTLLVRPSRCPHTAGADAE